MTSTLVRILVLGAAVAAPLAASAQSRGRYPETTGSIGRAPWQQPYEFDSGSDNDRRPELPYYQQGRGQQTGGPDRNLIPYDSITISPR